MPRSRTLKVALLATASQFAIVSALSAQGSLQAVVDQIKANTTAQSTPAPVKDPVAPLGKDWRNASSDQLTLSQGRELDKADNIGGLAIPSTGHRIFYGKTFGGKSFVVQRDLDTGKVVSSFSVADRVEALALSPKEDKLLVCLGYGGKGALVMDLTSQRSFELPITLPFCASPDDPLTWINDTTVVFDGKVLDLDTLKRELHASDFQYPPTKGKTYGTHPNAYYETVGGIGYTDLAICDRHSDYCHQMFPSMERWRSTQDMLHVVMIDFCNGCDPDYRLISWRLTTRRSPIREFSVELPATIGGESWDETRGEGRFNECVAKGVGFFGRISGPKINPLTGKTVASDGTDKGVVSLRGTPGSAIRRAIVVLEKLPISEGDVLDFVWSAEDCPGNSGYRADGLTVLLVSAVAR